MIQKTKKYGSCTNRYKYHTVVQANQYNFGSVSFLLNLKSQNIFLFLITLFGIDLFQDFQSVPLVKSRHKCEFSIDHKIYNSIECEEIHTFLPFSKTENGSQTITRQRLLLISENSVNSTMPGVPFKENFFFKVRKTECFASFF